MVVAIVGSRGIETDFKEMLPQGIEKIISGGARGVDRTAERIAKEEGIAIEVLDPDYKTYGRKAPLIRNREIVERAELVFAVWDGRSRGTKFTMDEADRRGKGLLVYLPGQK